MKDSASWRRRRREALERADNRCSLCAAPLLAGEVHHIIFQAAGGGDSSDNLMAVCRSCHGNFPHRMFALEEADILRLAAQRWERLVLAGKQAAIASSWGDAVEPLLVPGVRTAALAIGAFEAVEAMAASVLEAARPDNRKDRIAAFRLSVLMAEMAGYLGRAEDLRDYLGRQRRRVSLSELRPADRNYFALGLARLCHEAEDDQGEERALGQYTSESADNSEFSFRKASFALRLGLPIDQGVGGVAQIVPSSSSAGMQMAIGNLVADQARRLLARDEVELAYEEFGRSFLIARRVFHRRGMFFAGLRLAATALELGEAQFAANWWLAADQFRSAGVRPELSAERLRVAITRIGGAGIFATANADRATLAAMLSPNVKALMAV